MLNISNAFKQELFNDNRAYLCYADITLTNGTVLNITNSDIWANGFQFEEAVSASDDFSVGSVIVGQFILTLNNIYEKFSEHNFEGATVIAYIGLKLPDGTTEKIRKGTYFVDEPTYNGTTITLNCLDYLAKLDRPYSESKLTYPATLQQIVRDACSVCGVTLLTTTFDNGTYTVQERPDDEALTFREVVGFAAQIVCKWVKVDVYGRLSLGWYAQGLIDRGGLDGGIFDEDNPYSTGDDADGGLFNPWDTGYVIDGGTFKEQNEYHHIYSMSSMKVGTDDVVITGVQVTDSAEEEETYLYGNEGYVIAIEGNDFVQSGNAQEVARFIGNQIIGFRFRAFDISHLNDPSIEAGDLVYITDRKQNTYLSMITNTSFKVGQYQNSSCGAQSVSKNSAAEFSVMTKSIVKSRKEAQKEAAKQISSYDKAVQQLTSLITQSFGVYKTEEVLEDGSTIYYMHNKPTVAESQTIWKMTADAFAVSTDGGKTWNAGMDSSGNAVVNVLSAIGINFDWAHGGTLTLGGQNNTNGSMTVLNAAGNKVAGMDVNGLLARAGSIAGWDINSGQIIKHIDLYDDMSSSGLADLGPNDPVQYWVWMRAPTEENTWVFAICYKRKSDYLAGNDTVYRIFSATAAGVVTADTFNSANANITGGNINITTADESISAIRLNFGGHYLDLHSSGVESYYEGTNAYARLFASQYGGRIYLLQNDTTWCNLTPESGINIFLDSSVMSSILCSMYIDGSLSVHGAKNRLINTRNFGKVLQYCYETPSPMFGDVGSGTIGDDGLCYIYFDPVFAETVSADCAYYVFLQKEGDGDVWVSEKAEEYFIVKGTPRLSFAWEAKARQKDYEYCRLDVFEDPESKDGPDIDYDTSATLYLSSYEREILDYEEIN